MLHLHASVLCAHVSMSVRPVCMCTPCACVCISVCVCVCASASAHCRLQPQHERQRQPGHGDPRTPQAFGRAPFSLSFSLALSLSLALSFPLSLFHPSLAPCISPALLPSAPLQSHFTRPNEVRPHKVNLGLPVAFVVSTARAWPLSSVNHGPARLNSPANTYYQTRPVITFAPYMGDVTRGQGSFGTLDVLPSTSMSD